jgi:cytochrome c biogenesis protein CcmG/thiol:disulfide interchange protein DsbE
MTRRTKIAVTLGLLTAAVILLGRSYAQRVFLTWLAFHDVAPSEDAVKVAVDHANDPTAAVRRLWDSGRIVARKEAINYLRHHATIDSALWPATRDIVLAASRSGDQEAQESALAVLDRTHDPQAVEVAAGWLRDTDPETRQFGLLFLQRRHDKHFASIYMQMLDDTDAKVVDLASAALSDLTDQDFGIRYDADHISTTQPSFVAGVTAWKKWWERHRAEFPAAPPDSAASVLGPGVSASDFALTDLNGNKVRLGDFRGKSVLINFWATWCGSCVHEIPDLVELQRRRPELVILGVAVDADPHDDDDEPKGNEDALTRIKRYAAQKQINYRVLIDHDAEALAPYAGGDLPVSILIDPQGMVRRRMIGPRPLVAWEALADSLKPADPGMSMAVSRH